MTKHLLLLEELDDRDEEGETEWLRDAPEYACEVVVDAIGGDWCWLEALVYGLTPAMGEW